MLFRLGLASFAVWGATLLVPAATRAESVPELSELVARSRVIVFGRIELVDDQLLCRVAKVLKGDGLPTASVRQIPQKHVDPRHTSTAEPLDAGTKLFLFYLAGNQPRGHVEPPDLRLPDLRLPDLRLVVTDGRVTYPPADVDGLNPPAAVTVKQFQQQIAALLAATPPQPAAQPAMETQDHWRLAGPWKLLLPAGYEREVTFVRIDGNRYRLEPTVLTLGGEYELQGDRLVRCPAANEQPPLAYEWRFLSRHLVHLDVQPPKSRPADYDGAVLFRPREAVPVAPQ